MTSPSQRALSALTPFLTHDPAALATTHATSALHALAASPSAILCDHVLGLSQLLPTARALSRPHPIFDLASVTKIIVPATLAMQAVTQGVLSLSTPLQELLPEWDNQATLLHLLNHTSGLPAWHKYYLEYPLEGLTQGAWRAQREAVLERVIATPKAPAGSVYAYSDLGYMALMVVLERALGERLDVLARERIFAPLEMERTRYVNLLEGDEPLEDAVTTELCPVRGVVRGIVHDENTQVLGGVSGHAGVFGSAHDLLKFARALLEVDAGEERHALGISPEVLGQFWSEQARAQGGHHVAGWDTPSGERSSAGRGFPRSSTVGHLGFTGTSLWMDRASGTAAILLTNRVHPTRENPRIFAMRVAFHEAIMPA